MYFLQWHLGYFAKDYTPLYRGFDTHYGLYLGMVDHWKYTAGGPGYFNWGYDFRDQWEVARDHVGRYSTEVYRERAKKIIQEHDQSKPMFLYLSYQAVHTPVQASSSSSNVSVLVISSRTHPCTGK